MKIGDLVKSAGSSLREYTDKDFGVVVNIVIDHMTGLSYLDILCEEKLVRHPDHRWRKVKNESR